MFPICYWPKRKRTHSHFRVSQLRHLLLLFKYAHAPFCCCTQKKTRCEWKKSHESPSNIEKSVGRQENEGKSNKFIVVTDGRIATTGLLNTTRHNTTAYITICCDAMNIISFPLACLLMLYESTLSVVSPVQLSRASQRVTSFIFLN